MILVDLPVREVRGTSVSPVDVRVRASSIADRGGSIAHELFDFPGCFNGVLVLPDPHDPPAVGLQARNGVAIALLIREDFRSPKIGVRFRPCRMKRTSMPEATVNKDSYPRTTKCNIRDSTWLG